MERVNRVNEEVGKLVGGFALDCVRLREVLQVSLTEERGNYLFVTDL